MSENIGRKLVSRLTAGKGGNYICKNLSYTIHVAIRHAISILGLTPVHTLQVYEKCSDNGFIKVCICIFGGTS